MTEALQRTDIVELLQSLGSDRDEEVLAAARELHARVTDADLAWDDLLVADPAADRIDYAEADQPEADEPPAEVPGNDAEADQPEAEEPPAEAPGNDAEADQPEAEEPPAETPGDDAEAHHLIDKLLAKPGISDNFAAELNGYKSDLAEGEFEEADHRYVRALYKRLMPKDRS